MLDNEAGVVRRAKQGDPAAFAEIYDRHQQAIYTYIYYRVNDPLLAEDLTGEVFVRLVEKIDRFTYRGRPILAWLYIIARNLVADHQRKQAKIGFLPLDERLVAQEANPLDAVERRLTQDCLARAMRHLTDDQRRVIQHKFIENRSNAETAALLGKSAGAVKSLQHRALAALRRAMRKERCYEQV